MCESCEKIGYNVAISMTFVSGRETAFSKHTRDKVLHLLSMKQHTPWFSCLLCKNFRSSSKSAISHAVDKPLIVHKCDAFDAVIKARNWL